MISRSINSNKICTAIFIDFKKALDTVNHDILKFFLKTSPLRYTWLTITLVKELFNKKTSISPIQK